QGYNEERATRMVEGVYDIIENIYKVADRDGLPTYKAADRMAQERIARVGKVTLPHIKQGRDRYAAARRRRSARARASGPSAFARSFPGATYPSPTLYNVPSGLPAQHGHLTENGVSVIRNSLNEDIDMLREAVQRFAATEIAPLAAEIDHKNEFPQALWPRLGEMGLLGITIPEEYGGAGMGYLAHVVAMEEISRASASVGLSYGAHSNLCLNNLYLNANEEQRRKYLPKLCSG